MTQVQPDYRVWHHEDHTDGSSAFSYVKNGDMMTRSFATFVLWGVFIFFSTQVTAVTLSLEPSTQDTDVGTAASVDLNISRLGVFAPNSLGAFLVKIIFDDSVLSFDSVVYGSLLGHTDPSAFEIDILTTVGAGSVSLDKSTFLSDIELDVLQPANFILSTLSSTGDTVSTSSLEFGSTDLVETAFPSSTIFADMSASV